MTSIRQKAKTNSLEKSDIEFFKKYKGFAPLCCYELHLAHPRTQRRYKEPLYKCDQIEIPIPFSEFEKFCLECQKKIQAYITQLENKK